MSEHKVLTRANLPFFLFAISYIAIIIIVIAYFPAYIGKENFQLIQTHTLVKKIKSTFNLHMPLRSRKQIDENQSSLLPPFNLTEQERILWFRANLPKFDIFKSNELTQRFHSRVLEFFDHECDVKFFMIWISPAASFGRREFFAVESLFKAHPYGCLIILSKTMDSVDGHRILKPLLDRRFKVLAVTPDLNFLFKNTQAEDWLIEMKKGNRDPGKISFAQNLSNIVRLAALYKYGGVYLDTDFIMLKSFKGLRNTIGAQSIDAVTNKWTRLNNAVLVFDTNHPLLLMFMEEFAATFDGNKWGHNGPYMVSRVVEKVQGKPGLNFTILPPMAFYPVDWIRINGFFKKPESRNESEWNDAKLLQLREETYAVHLWNRRSKNLVVDKGSIIESLMSTHCVICKNASAS